MTALGFFLCSMAALWYKASDAHLYASKRRLLIAEFIAVTGALLIICGISLTLWKYLP